MRRSASSTRYSRPVGTPPGNALSHSPITPLLCWRAGACGQRRTHALDSEAGVPNAVRVGWSSVHGPSSSASEERRRRPGAIHPASSHMEIARASSSAGSTASETRNRWWLRASSRSMTPAGSSSSMAAAIGMAASALVTSPSASI